MDTRTKSPGAARWRVPAASAIQRLIVAGALAVTAAAQAHAATPARPLTLDDYYRLQSVGEVELSPDGRWVAYTLSTPDRRTDRDTSDIWMVRYDGGEPLQLTHSEVNEHSPHFSADGGTLAFLRDPADGKGTPEEQKSIAAATAKTMLPLLELDNQLVIVHGNGPQVGKLLLASAIARERIAPQSLDILVAQTQGATAYILAQAFENALREAGNPRHVVGLVTQVEVDPDDPAFRTPTKPVGPFFGEAEARAIAAAPPAPAPRGSRTPRPTTWWASIPRTTPP